VQVVLTAIGLLLAWDQFALPQSGGAAGGGSATSIITLVVIVVICASVVGTILLLLPRFRHTILGRVRPRAAEFWANFRVVSSHPGKLGRLFAGGAIGQILYALALQASVHAYGGSVTLPALLVVSSLVSLFGGMAPTPGGMGVMEAGYIFG